jgi:hypothetical protein
MVLKKLRLIDDRMIQIVRCKNLINLHWKKAIPFELSACGNHECRETINVAPFHYDLAPFVSVLVRLRHPNANFAASNKILQIFNDRNRNRFSARFPWLGYI